MLGITSFFSGKSFLPLIVCLLCGLIVGWADSWESVQTSADKVQSLQAEFIQKKHLEILSEPLVSKGEFFFQAPDSLRLEYNSPVRSVTLVHQDSHKRYIQGENGLISDSDAQLSVMRHVLQEISLWLQGNFRESANFAASLDPGQKIVLTPKKEAIQSAIDSIELQLAQKPGIIKKVTIYEKSNSYTEIIFRDISLNDSLKDSLFQKLQ